MSFLPLRYAVPLLMIFTACRAYAEDEHAPDPISFEEVLPEAKGYRDLQLNVVATKETWTVPKVDIFFGLTDRISGEVAVPFQVSRQGGGNQAGVGDAEVGLKYLLLREREMLPALVAISGVSFPTGSERRGLGLGRTSLDESLGWLKTTGPWTAQGDAGFSITNQQPQREIFYDISISRAWIKPWRFYGEFHGARDLIAVADDFELGPGVLYNLSPEAYLGFATLVGLTPDSENYRFVLKFQIGF